MFTRKHIKRLLALLILATVVIVVIVASNRSQPAPDKPAKPVPAPTVLAPITSRDVENAVNEVRVQKGLPKLADNRLLNDSAMARANSLCDSNTFSHDGWEASLTYSYSKAGENLEWRNAGSQTPRTIVDSWVNSPEHYENIADPQFTEQGMGVRYCDNFQESSRAVIVVNHFGAPK